MTDYSDQTRCKHIVAKQSPSGIWNLYFACDDFQTALETFKNIQPDTRYKAAAVFTRSQWYGNRDSYRYHKNLSDRSDEPIPDSFGMWLINQADAGYF